MKTKTQLESWDGQKVVRLWILKTDKGKKRTWKATQSEAVDSAKAHGLVVLSVRSGNIKDAWIK